MASTEALEDSPQAQMGRMLGGYRTTQMLHVAAKLGLPDILASGPMSVEALAVTARVHPPSLHRLLRALSSMGVFAERRDGTFESTPLAATLRSDADGGLRAFALSYGESWWWNSFGMLRHSIETGETGFRKVHGMELFEYLGRNPEAARVFNENMTAMTRREADSVVAAYDFSGTRVLVDIGGGHGALATAILRRQPGARAVIFDQPSVIAGAGPALGEPGVASRCELAGGDFFQSVPGGADTYTLKDILHDWDDERSTAILLNIRRAMSGGASLLVIERVIDPGNEAQAGKLVDITMLALTGGMERTRAQYQRLLEGAGLRMERIIATQSGSSIIVAKPE